MTEKLSFDEIRDIISRDMKGYVVATNADRDTADHVNASAQSHAKDLEFLSQKFSGRPRRSLTTERSSPESSNQIVSVRPASTDDSSFPTKVVVVSANERKVIAEQG